MFASLVPSLFFTSSATMTTLIQTDDDLLYPESDGQPMAENTEQFQWIVTLKENLEILFASDPNVFIAGDLLWYPQPVIQPPAPRQAPDVMVVFGRPKAGRRGSYRQWVEANQPPQVVFEILSPSNKTRQEEIEMDAKFLFYQCHGVEEYYIYDPDDLMLQGWIRQGDTLEAIRFLAGWRSPRLGIRFEWRPGEELEVYYPNGKKFITSIELADQLEQEHQRAEQYYQRAEQERQSRLDAIPRLLALGLTLEQISAALGIPLEDMETYL